MISITILLYIVYYITVFATTVLLYFISERSTLEECLIHVIIVYLYK